MQRYKAVIQPFGDQAEEIVTALLPAARHIPPNPAESTIAALVGAHDVLIADEGDATTAALEAVLPRRSVDWFRVAYGPVAARALPRTSPAGEVTHLRLGQYCIDGAPPCVVVQGTDLLPPHGVRVVALRDSALPASFRHHISRLGGAQATPFALAAPGFRTRDVTYPITPLLAGVACELERDRTAVVEVLGSLEDAYRDGLFDRLATIAARADVPLTWIGA